MSEKSERLFRCFASQEERRRFGGSCFIEMQFCRMSVGTKIYDLVAVENIRDWQNDSLYICDENTFHQEYAHIFDGGTYNNLKSGRVDIYGINYYTASSIDILIERIRRDQPVDCETLLEWLNKAKAYNGFYILGI